MVVKVDGTKWACQSCLKGHRVSGCTHTDRELFHVPKKGRPVTQCQHCRLERKKRSAHVKCDCGEVEKPHHPKEKCIHLREAEERAKAGFHDDHAADKDPAHLAAVAEEQGCCCLHGGKCSCACLKKDQNKCRDDGLPHGPAVPKPRLETTRSDGSLTVFANGHHKPVHRKNHAAHECGMPYKMPMSRAHTEQLMSNRARRSVDSLALDTAMQSRLMSLGSQNGGFANQNFSNSEQPSPKAAAVCQGHGGLIDANLSSVDFSDLGPTRTAQSIDSTGSDFMALPQLDPMSATADSSYDPWSNFPSADGITYPDNNPFGAWATNFDNNGTLAQPALTAASSGTQSEIDEVPPMEDLHSLHMPSIQETGPLDLDVNFGDAGNINRRSLPPNFFKNFDFDMSTAVGNEWPTEHANGVSEEAGTKTKATDYDSMFANYAIGERAMPKGNPAQRPTNPFATGRSQSHSIGPGQAPTPDIMKQVFPEYSNGSFGQNNDLLDLSKFGGLPVPNSTSNGNEIDFGDDSEFTSSMWADGSISVPNNDFATNYHFVPDFASPNFPANWQQ